MKPTDLNEIEFLLKDTNIPLAKIITQQNHNMVVDVLYKDKQRFMESTLDEYIKTIYLKKMPKINAHDKALALVSMCKWMPDIIVKSMFSLIVFDDEYNVVDILQRSVFEETLEYYIRLVGIVNFIPAIRTYLKNNNEFLGCHLDKIHAELLVTCIVNNLSLRNFFDDIDMRKAMPVNMYILFKRAMESENDHD